MAQTITEFYFHTVFSTKNRVEFIKPEIEEELYAYIGGILNNYDSKLLFGNGTSNHSHLLLSLNKNVLIPDIVGTVKRSSSKWLKTKGGRFAKFGWQDGYSSFTVGHSQLEMVKRYIANQKEHHRKMLFEDEMRSFYRKYGIQFDERYVWD
jgi:REP element-mobilizing transposase RayT